MKILTVKTRAGYESPDRRFGAWREGRRWVLVDRQHRDRDGSVTITFPATLWRADAQAAVLARESQVNGYRSSR